MADSTLRVLITGDSTGARRAMSDLESSATSAGEKIGTEMEGATSRVGGAFSRLAAIGNNWGLPFTSSLESLGSKFDEAEQKGKGFSQAMSTLGGATLLGVGAGAVAVGVEAIRMADSFDTAEASLKTAVKNAGGDFTALKPKIDAAYGSMAQMGFNSTETASALAQLTTATGSPTKAMQDLQVAGDLARLKNVSLSDASGVLTKTLAGSTRALTQLGLNLDIGSAKLSSMYTASQTLQTAQQHLDEIQSRLADGSLKKNQASLDTLANAQRSVQVAAQNLARDQAAGGNIMDALRQKTQGAAKAYGDTLPGQVEVARAELHNLGTTIGVQLEPKLIELGRDTMDVVLWFEKHKAAAEALGVVIGGTLATAVGVFTYGKLKDLATGLKGIVTDVTGLGSKLTGLFGGSSAGGVAPSTATGAFGGTSLEPAATSLETAGAQLQGAATKLGAGAEGLEAEDTQLGLGAKGLQADDAELGLASGASGLAGAVAAFAPAALGLATLVIGMNEAINAGKQPVGTVQTTPAGKAYEKAQGPAYTKAVQDYEGIVGGGFSTQPGAYGPTKTKAASSQPLRLNTTDVAAGVAAGNKASQQPVSHVTTINMNGTIIQAPDANSLVAQVQQKARVAALSGGSTRAPMRST